MTRSSLGLRSRVWPQMIMAITLLFWKSGVGFLARGGEGEGWDEEVRARLVGLTGVNDD